MVPPRSHLADQTLRSDHVDNAGVLRVRKHVYCIGCGYDLFQQPMIGVCPECGTSVQRSRVSLPLDSDLDWQWQIERGLKWAIAADSLRLTAYVAAIVTAFFSSASTPFPLGFPPAACVLFLTTFAAALTEFRSRDILWDTPVGCEPLVSHSTGFAARGFELASEVGLILAGVGAASVSISRFGVVICAIGCVLIAIGILRLPGFYRLLRVIAKEIGSDHLPREIGLCQLFHVAIEVALFPAVAMTVISLTVQLPALGDAFALFLWLGAIGYACIQPFVIGCQYNLWRRVREVHQLELQAQAERSKSIATPGRCG